MRISFEFADRSEFAPAAMARLLSDIDGLVFSCIAIEFEDLMTQANIASFFDREYESAIYLSAEFDEDDPNYDLSRFYSKLRLESLVYRSPPKIDVSIRASINADKIVATVLDFVKFLLTLREQKQILRAKAYKERQGGIKQELRNFRETAVVIQSISDENLRGKLEDYLVSRIDALTYGRDYPELVELHVRRPRK